MTMSAEIEGVRPSVGASPVPATVKRSALEGTDFPFELLSDIAEAESWRKEVNRPIYHVHKWWAQRLGSVFRAILLGATLPSGADVLEAFYKPGEPCSNLTVLDPFMGSGTTVGEALKLGARAIGRDINPVAEFAVRTALTRYDRRAVAATYEAIETDVGSAIRRLYRAELDDGSPAESLYYFWVKVVGCPSCASAVRLFSTFVFARNAYPGRIPESQILCPACGAINMGRYDANELVCARCATGFDPSHGPARRGTAECPHCGDSFSVVNAVRALTKPPDHEMYAKLVLAADGRKRYLESTAFDRKVYQEAQEAVAGMGDLIPTGTIERGNNTDQALNYGYRSWHQFFNSRQLLALGLLARRIAAVEDGDLRQLFACLFSGTLEFNNMFASYKGEGTGAVRHMFAHHVLKPERTPLEANVWGTPKSSGAFSSLYRSRMVRALDYQAAPFELRLRKGTRGGTEKVFGLSEPMGWSPARSYEEFSSEGSRVYLSVGDSSELDLPDGSVDLVVTDPPFFDNVHYSELADFFYAWHPLLKVTPEGSPLTTRSDHEVQAAAPEVFAERLAGVLRECNRVLRPGGLLVFSYHHSRTEGWASLLHAVHAAGFGVSAAQPVKAEMAGAMPKSQADSPINLDVILVCRRLDQLEARPAIASVLSVAADHARLQIRRFARAGRVLSRNDVRVIFMAQLAVEVSLRRDLDSGLLGDDHAASIELVLDQLFAEAERAGDADLEAPVAYEQGVLIALSSGSSDGPAS
jgi:putative DNA methylase